MRRLRGKFRERNSETNLRTELRELRSSAMTVISEPGNSDKRRALASSAAFRLRTGSTSRAPLFANTLAVSAPIPDVAPVMMAVMERRS
uniref:Short-chain dehydrogenase TIC 32ic isoform X1 n=1 Tax=Rhizophora mucronata TaxID=61149 RepID=A0A2P2QEQ4_RHIMU